MKLINYILGFYLSAETDIVVKIAFTVIIFYFLLFMLYFLIKFVFIILKKFIKFVKHETKRNF